MWEVGAQQLQVASLSQPDVQWSGKQQSPCEGAEGLKI